jgi:ABC-2 type transport system ATP-binding protein
VNNDAVIIRNLSKVFDPKLPPALKNVNATIAKGQILGLAGPDGAGKTTLIRLMAGLLKPTEGVVLIEGFDTIKDAPVISSFIGYMPQKFGLYEDLTVLQNLNLYADLQGLVKEKKKETFERLLKFTGLTPFTGRFAKALSGGMKQKLGLACALLSKPAVLLLDEPSVGVDPISRRELWKMVLGLIEEGITVVWSTSYLDEAERCDSVILLNEGGLLYHGTPKELTDRVKGRVFKISSITGSRRQLLSEILRQPNILDGTIQGADVRIVTREQDKPPVDLKLLADSSKLVISPSAPRFEDAFIDILGGGPGGVSVLAETIPRVKPKNELVVKASHLTKRFGDFVAASDISFEVPQGEIFGLLGPNGAGKSTTFKMLCGLLKPTSGEAFVNGLHLQQAPSEARSHIGYMAQKFSLYGNLSVKENMEFFSGINNLAGARRKEIIDEMVQIFNLKALLDENAQFSFAGD